MLRERLGKLEIFAHCVGKTLKICTIKRLRRIGIDEKRIDLQQLLGAKGEDGRSI